MIYAMDITSQNFNEITSNSNLTMVYIKADWCGPCKSLSPIVQEVASEKGGSLLVGYVDADSQMDLVKSLNVRNIPTLLFYKNGKQLDRTTGLKSKPDLLKMIDEVNQLSTD